VLDSALEGLLRRLADDDSFGANRVELLRVRLEDLSVTGLADADALLALGANDEGTIRLLNELDLADFGFDGDAMGDSGLSHSELLEGRLKFTEGKNGPLLGLLYLKPGGSYKNSVSVIVMQLEQGPTVPL